MILTGNDDTRLNLAQSIPQVPDAKSSQLGYAQHAHYLTTETGEVIDHDWYSQESDTHTYKADSIDSKKSALTELAPSDQISSINSDEVMNNKPLGAGTSKIAVTDTTKLPTSSNISNVSASSDTQQNQSKPSSIAKEAHDSWVVRLATFGNPENARNLASRLKQDGYNAYTQLSKRIDKNYTYVLVGLNSNHDVKANNEKQTVQKLSDDLQAKYNLKGMVIESQPASRS